MIKLDDKKRERLKKRYLARNEDRILNLLERIEEHEKAKNRLNRVVSIKILRFKLSNFLKFIMSKLIKLDDKFKERLKEKYLERNEDLILDLFEEIEEHKKAIRKLSRKVNKLANINILSLNGEENDGQKGKAKK